MKDSVYPYDQALYGRSFFNCYQRQSLVMLAERTPDIHLLFYRCLIETDDILEQIIRNQNPKYGFTSGFFAADDLRGIGVVPKETSVDTYAEARNLLLETVERQGFAIPVVDVYYFPHCPEYRRGHLVHTVTLTGFDEAAGEWSLVDDNPASVLCRYTYPEEVVAAAFDNNTLRRVRHFEFPGSDGAESPERAFAGLLAEHRDELTLFTDASDLLTCPWIARERAISLLHDAFSIYQGSRLGLLEYVRRVFGDPEAEAALRRSVAAATDIQSMLLVGKVSGSVDADRLGSACGELRKTEEESVSRLRALAEAGA